MKKFSSGPTKGPVQAHRNRHLPFSRCRCEPRPAMLSIVDSRCVDQRVVSNSDEWILHLISAMANGVSSLSWMLNLAFAAAVAIASPHHQRSCFGKKFVVVIFLELKNSVLRIITI